MLVKLLSSQVPQYWEIIKYAVVRVDRVDQEDLQSYLNELLQALLSDKAQCWIRIASESREIIALLITRVRIDKIGIKFLYLQSVYSFEKVKDNVWIKEFEFIKEFADRKKYPYISFTSSNKNVWKLATELLGFKEISRHFRLRLKGDSNE